MTFALAAILGFSIATVIYCFSEGISGNDFWWHIKVGEWIVENRTVPQTDIFSWYGTAKQIPWTPHEWLADIILYLIHAQWNELGVFLFSLSSALVMMGLLWQDARNNMERNILSGGLFFVLLAVTTSMFFYGRPHMFSYFLLWGELKILYRFIEEPSYKGIMLLPLLSAIWSNLHGGSAALSYVLCAVFLVIGAMNVKIGRIESKSLEKQAWLRLLIVTLCTAAAIMLNPVGVDVFLYPYRNLGDQLQMTLISEWRSPDAKKMGELLLFFFPIVLMMLGFLAHEKQIRLIDLAVMGLFVFMFVRSVRFIMLWYIAAVFCAFPYMPVVRVKPVTPREETRMTAAVLVLVALLIGTCSLRIRQTTEKDQLISETMSDEAVNAVKQDAPERLFNDYNLGEAMIYHEIPVYFDARADLYAYDGLLADGVSLMFLEQANSEAAFSFVDVSGLIEKYGFDNILILKSRALYSYLINHPDAFACLYEDEQIGYFTVIR